jgi:glutamate/tyrosine decarboxylase-like PLP-dependent enzyme
MALQAYGLDGYRDMIDRNIRLAAHMARGGRARPGPGGAPVLVRRSAHPNHRATQVTAASTTTSSSSSTVANTPIGSVRRGAECVHSTPARTG